MTPPVPYTFRAALVRVIDGDTQVYRLDFRAHRYGDMVVRLLGVNTPETIGVTAEQGKAASSFARRWLLDAGNTEWPLVIETKLDQDDKYGRLLGTVYRVMDGKNLNDALIESGNAVPYDGGKR